MKLLAVLLLALLPALETGEPNSIALAWLESHQEEITALSDSVWDHPESAHAEFRTVETLTVPLAKSGFQIERGLAGLPTAFTARRGAGRPVIGIVALLDALPGLSQEAGALERKPLAAGGPGHGCGHHLIAAADVAAARALAEALEASRLQGTIMLIGAPAEEIYHGGVYLARAGVFDDLDALLFWHPSTVTAVIARSGLALESVKLVFHGLASDATDASDKGRNALAAVERLIAAVEGAKPDWPPPAVINHVLELGPAIPSVVPERAAAWYFIHARDLGAVEAIRRRVAELGAGIASETGTGLELQILSRTSNWLINRSFCRRIHDELAREEEPRYAEAEVGLASALRATMGTMSPGSEAPVFHRALLPLEFSDDPLPISDDTAEASWLVPRAGFLVTCFPSGLPSHSWQWTAAGKTSFAHQGMLRATRTLVRSALDLLTDARALAPIREEFEKEPRRRGYRSPLPRALGPFDYLVAPGR